MKYFRWIRFKFYEVKLKDVFAVFLLIDFLANTDKYSLD